MKTTACKSCGAPIVWACVASGKRAPFDLAETPDGEWGIDDREAQPRAEKIDRDIETQPGHKSHFATCPDAKAWRRKPAAPLAAEGKV